MITSRTTIRRWSSTPTDPVQRVSLIDACRDPALFGLDPWPAQADLLAEIDSGRYREVVCAWGRRSGKSIVASVVGTHDAIFRDLRRYLRPGERRSVAIVAVSREQAGVCLGMCRDLIVGSPLLHSTLEAEGDDYLLVRQPDTGARVILRTLPCSARSARGYAISCVIFDEMAHWISDSEGFQVADRVYSSLTPSTAQFGEHARVVSISTPWGSTNLFAKIHRRASEGSWPGALAVQAPTWAVNPTLSESFFEEERAKDAAMFESEYAARFAAGGGALLDADVIERAVVSEHETPPGECSRAVAGLDLAFSRDSSALVIAGRLKHPRERGVAAVDGQPGGNAHTERLHVVCSRQWRPTRGESLTFRGVIAEAAATCRLFGARTVVVDQFASAAASEELRAHGLRPSVVPFTAQNKAGLYAAVRQRLADQTLTLYRDERLVTDLARLTVHYSSGGTVQVRAPRSVGSHGDSAAALVLALSAAPTRSRGRSYSPAGRGRVAMPGPRSIMDEQPTYAPLAVATGDAGEARLDALRGR